MSISPCNQSLCPADSANTCWEACFGDRSSVFAQELKPNQIELLQFDQAGLLTLESTISLPVQLENPIEIKQVFFNSDGTCIVTWKGEADEDQSVCTMIFERDGKPRYDDPLCAAPHKFSNINNQAVHQNDDGTFEITWDEIAEDGSSIAKFRQSFDQEGNRIGGRIEERVLISDYEQSDDHVAEIHRDEDGFEAILDSP